MADDGLYYLIRHIFLPPKLQRYDDISVSKEWELLDTACDALRRSRSCLDATQTPAVDRCIRMLEGMLDRWETTSPWLRPDVFARQLADLEENDCLAVYIHGQNSGLLVTRLGVEMRFESMELLAPVEVVMGCPGRLQRHFPTRAVAVARSRVLDPAFLRPFLDVLSRIELDAKRPLFHDLQRMLRTPEEKTMPFDPRLVNDMIMGVLRGIGRSMADEIDCVYKNSREEAILEKWYTDNGRKCHEFHLRRSPLWFLIRVALQLTLQRAAGQRGRGGDDDDDDGNHTHHGRPLYKALMIFLMSCVLERAASHNVPHDLLLFVKTKISQRILKLGPAPAEAAWSNFPREVLHRVDVMLTKSWDAIQSDNPHPLSGLSGLDFGRDTLLTVDYLVPYLAWIKKREPEQTLDDGGFSFPFHRYGGDDSPRDAFSNTENHGYFELADFENWVEARANKDAKLSWGLSPAEGEDGAAACGQDAVPISRAVNKGSQGLVRSISAGQSSDSGWLRLVDNVFAPEFWARHQAADEWPQAPSRLCDSCGTLQVLDENFELFVRPIQKSEDCDLCEMLYKVLWPHGEVSNRPVRVRRQGTNLWADGQSSPVLRMCVGPEWQGDGTVQIGPPQLLERASPSYYGLLRSWLRHCDDTHGDYGCYTESQAILPTRVIDVGDGSDGQNYLRLLHTKSSDRGRYVALSHCWGKPDAEERGRNCTFKGNLEARCRRINLAELGKTFQDAVKVTRALGQRYLWIDSLCIVQEDTDDWARESMRMAAVFSSAYYVIAATAADGGDSGFLKSPPLTQPVVLSTPSGAPLYLCRTIDDFEGDVEDAGLSCRGWVLQERALARRTIHFSAGQTYWECGRGIHCESMSLLSSQHASFFGDPQFPRLAIAQMTATNDNTAHRVFQVIFQTYSRLDLTRATDRPAAIAGLERRLADEMRSPVAFGIFDSPKYLHRSLLWRRGNDSLLQRIARGNPHLQVPTWSWMAYTGPIDYLDVAGAEVEWSSISLEMISSGPAVLKAPVTEFTAEMLRHSSRLVLDTCHTVDVRNLKCVVVAQELGSPESEGESGACYILVVSPAQTTSTYAEYERLGVAVVCRAHLALDSGCERVSII